MPEGQLAWPRMMASGMRLDAFPEQGPPGSDLDLMRSQHLDPLGIEFGIHLDGLHRRPAQAQRIHTRPVLCPLHSLNLQRARERVRVVLQRDHALYGRSIRVHGDDATSDQAGRVGERAHCLCFDE